MTLEEEINKLSNGETKRLREQIRTDDRVRVISYALTASTPLLTAPHTRAFLNASKFIDLILEPEDAENLIANLHEGFQRRAALEGGHARRWLWAQVGWIAFGRALDVVRNVVRARAGK